MAAAYNDDKRVLLVGVVDAKDGLFYTFNLTALAASDLDESIKLECYVEALIASSAVPVIFPPVYIDDHQYYDGGVRASVFMESTANTLALSSPTTEIYLVFNGYLKIEKAPDLKNSILATLLRTKSITFDQIDRYSLGDLVKALNQNV